MNFKVTKNNKNRLISITFNNIKHFDSSKVSRLLEIEDYTIVVDSVDITRNDENGKLKINHYQLLTQNSIYIQSESFASLQLLESLKNDESASNILIIDHKFAMSNELELLSKIKAGFIRFFIDINLGENQVFIMLSTKRYSSNIESRIKEILS